MHRMDRKMAQISKGPFTGRPATSTQLKPNRRQLSVDN